MRDYEEKSYYEIQLDNKQLILVFLAAVTVCVLIFVLGVMIGKGQKEAEFAATSGDDKKMAASEPDSSEPREAVADVGEEAAADEKSAPKEAIPDKTDIPKQEAPAQAKQQKPAPVVEKQPAKYAFEDLDKTDPGPATAQKEKEAPAVEAADPSTRPDADEIEEEPKPAGRSKYTVQVMATSSKPKAQEQISRLKSKGYEPFIDESKTGDMSVFKVRVGRFADAQEAKEMASKIKTDLKLESWVAPLD